jgi:NADH:ubiquinone oxidoreductase subunit E
MNPEELREHLQPIVANYPHAQAALVPVLHLLVEAKHSINDETMALVAELCEVDQRSIAEIVAYYPVFQNGHAAHNEVCFGLPCYLNGAREIYEQIKAGLTPVNGAGKAVNISPCLGHCYAAPVLRLEDGTLCRASLSNSNVQVEATHG